MQQINLYQPILKQQEKVFSAKALLQAGLVVMTGLLLVYGYASWQTRGLEQQLGEFVAQRDAANRRLASVAAQFPAPARDEQLVAQVEASRRELEAKRRLVDVLAKPDWGNTRGFSEQLEAFARRRPQQLWIRELRIAQGGREVGLVGSTFAPEQLPRFIQSLGDESSLRGIAFTRFLMERAEEEPRRVDFSVGTHATDGEKTP